MGIKEGDDIKAADFRGFIQLYAGATAPEGWFLCNGQAVSRTFYSNLFALIGTAYGSGDGSTTFNVPDLRGSVPVGAGQKNIVLSFSDTDVNTTTDIITVGSNQLLYTGMPVTVTSMGTIPSLVTAAGRSWSINGSGVITGDILNEIYANGQTITFDDNGSHFLSASVTYYVINLNPGVSFQVSSTPGGNVAGSGRAGGGSAAKAEGLALSTTYYVIKKSDSTIKLATTADNAHADIAINLTTNGGGLHSIEHLLSDRSMGDAGGEEEHSLIVAELASHTHPRTTNHAVQQSNWNSSGSEVLSKDADSEPAGGNQPHNNMPPFVVVNYIIKY